MAAFLLVVGTMVGCAPGGVAALRSEPPKRADHVAVGALSSRTGAYLTLADAAGRVRVQLATLPGLLYRISTPADSGLAPRVSSVAGRVRAELVPTGDDGPDEVRIVLNRDVRWALELPAGAGEQQLDLRSGRVTRLGLGASGLIELNLPKPDRTVPVTLEDGAGSAVVTTAAPVRIRLDQGAGLVHVPWGTPWPAAAGAVLEDPGWQATAGRYAIISRKGIGALTVRTA